MMNGKRRTPLKQWSFFLDAVMSDFLTKLENMRDSKDKEKTIAFYFMQKSYNFAKANRALGLGALGWHSLTPRKK